MIRNSKLIIYTDGGARGNPGPAALGVAMYDDTGKLFKKFGKYLGEKTNNEAEYEAIIAALEEALKLNVEQVEMRMDSELAMRQLNSIYRVKNHRLQELVLKVRNLETKFKKVSFKHVRREQNQLADKMVNEAIDNQVKSNESL